LNLAEDLNNEIKMKKKNIIPSLVKCFDRKNPDLLFLCISFLKKLSIFQENTSEMMSTENFLPKLAELVVHERDTVRGGALGLLFNLSFDPKTREEMLKTPNLVPNTVETLKSFEHLEATVKLLYQLSMNEKGQIEIGNIPNALNYVCS
jgi:hypothetical protein